MADPKTEFSHTDIVRMYEASCAVGFPTQHDLNFRLGLQKIIAQRTGMAALKDKEIVGPNKVGPPIKSLRTPARPF